jgi:ribosome biogenesis GTPase A
VCASIYEIKDKKSKKAEKTPPVEAMEMIAKLKQKIKQFTVQDINPVIRALGRRRLITPIFELIDCMRANYLSPDDESFEFLANALVVTVNEESKSKTMKDLPDPDTSMPEIVFAGRSNVGKSSLVNFLGNPDSNPNPNPNSNPNSNPDPNHKQFSQLLRYILWLG